MKVGDLVKQVSWGGFGIVTQVNRDRDKARWVMSQLVEIVNESR